MRLNEIKPAEGAKRPPHRAGRGMGSGLGKTAGRGHKGQKSRAGGFHKVGFEGGQMPLYRRLPKRGFFSSTRERIAEVRLDELDKLVQKKPGVINLKVLKEAGVIPLLSLRAKVILAGRLGRPVVLHGLNVTAGAAKAITAAGGKIEAIPPVGVNAIAPPLGDKQKEGKKVIRRVAAIKKIESRRGAHGN